MIFFQMNGLVPKAEVLKQPRMFEIISIINISGG
jgi:hypothetical protein